MLFYHNYSGVFYGLSQKATSKYVVHRKSGITYYGKVDMENPMIIHYWASYLKDGGVVTERLQFEKSDETNGKGKSEWNWSDGLMSCGGQYSFTAVQVER